MNRYLLFYCCRYYYNPRDWLSGQFLPLPELDVLVLTLSFPFFKNRRQSPLMLPPWCYMSIYHTLSLRSQKKMYANTIHSLSYYHTLYKYYTLGYTSIRKWKVVTLLFFTCCPAIFLHWHDSNMKRGILWTAIYNILKIPKTCEEHERILKQHGNLDNCHVLVNTR